MGGLEMDEKEVQKKIELAKQLVGGDAADPFRQIAFEIVFRKLLEDTVVEKATKEMPMELSTLQINEVLASKNLESHMDKVEAIAWYFLRQGEDSVTSKDIFEAYAKARLQRPRNLTDVINTSVSAKRGHLMDSPNKKDGSKAWSITRTGEKYIEDLLSNTEE
jgi:hypothetical protein